MTWIHDVPSGKLGMCGGQGECSEAWHTVAGLKIGCLKDGLCGDVRGCWHEAWRYDAVCGLEIGILGW